LNREDCIEEFQRGRLAKMRNRNVMRTAKQVYHQLKDTSREVAETMACMGHPVVAWRGAHYVQVTERVPGDLRNSVFPTPIHDLPGAERIQFGGEKDA